MKETQDYIDMIYAAVRNARYDADDHEMLTYVLRECNELMWHVIEDVLRDYE